MSDRQKKVLLGQPLWAQKTLQNKVEELKGKNFHYEEQIDKKDLHISGLTETTCALERDIEKLLESEANYKNHIENLRR